jgi:hypothetical protein
MKVDMYRERYDSPYKGTLDLAGCGGGGTPFSQLPRVTAEELQGSWQVVDSASCSPASSAGRASETGCACTRDCNLPESTLLFDNRIAFFYFLRRKVLQDFTGFLPV